MNSSHYNQKEELAEYTQCCWLGRRGQGLPRVLGSCSQSSDYLHFVFTDPGPRAGKWVKLVQSFNQSLGTGCEDERGEGGINNVQKLRRSGLLFYINIKWMYIRIMIFHVIALILFPDVGHTRSLGVWEPECGVLTVLSIIDVSRVLTLLA